MHSSMEDPVASRIAQVKQQLADLEARLPAHSVPPAMAMELEALEEELEQLQKQLRASRP
jgi:hypothetical protein